MKSLGALHGISVGSKSIYQDVVIWKVSEDDYVSIQNGDHYTQLLKIRRKTSWKVAITLSGSIWKKDDTSGNDLVGSTGLGDFKIRLPDLVESGW